MRIAIVGAGFCGLAAAWHFSNQIECSIELFDPAGVGGGASGIATGLLHPYPGEQMRRSWKADEGIAATKELLAIASEKLGRPVADFNGVERLNFKTIPPFDDIELLDETRLLITSGITVFTSLYLQGLWLACEEKGVLLREEKVAALRELEDFDAIVVAAGADMLAFEECRGLPIKLVKGQVLKCRWPADLPKLTRSKVAKGYLAMEETGEFCQLGATYEREFTHWGPDLERALQELRPRMKTFVPVDLEVVECKAAVRVANTHHYMPLMQQIGPKAWVLTAMGSRGLMYHAYFAKELIENIIAKKGAIPLNC